MWEELEQYAKQTGFGTIRLKIHEEGITGADIETAKKTRYKDTTDNVLAGSEALHALKLAQTDKHTGIVSMRFHFKEGIIKESEIDDTWAFTHKN